MTVQDQGIFVLSKISLSIRTRLLQVFRLTNDVLVSVTQQLHACHDILLVGADFLVLRSDDLVKLSDING